MIEIKSNMALADGEALCASLQGMALRATMATPANATDVAAGAAAAGDKATVTLVLVQSAESHREHAVYVFSRDGTLHSVFPIFDTTILKAEGSTVIVLGLQQDPLSAWRA